MIEGGEVSDHDIRVPKNLKNRGEQLQWIADEAQRLAGAYDFDAVAIQKAAGGGKFGPSPERSEIEAAVQMGLFKAKGLSTNRLTKEGVRAALKVVKAPGAYETLLERDDVKPRKNEACRHQYLLALAAE